MTITTNDAGTNPPGAYVCFHPPGSPVYPGPASGSITPSAGVNLTYFRLAYVTRSRPRIHLRRGGLLRSNTSNVPIGVVTFSPSLSAAAIESKITFTAASALGWLSSFGSHFDLSVPVRLGEIA